MQRRVARVALIPMQPYLATPRSYELWMCLFNRIPEAAEWTGGRFVMKSRQYVL